MAQTLKDYTAVAANICRQNVSFLLAQLARHYSAVASLLTGHDNSAVAETAPSNEASHAFSFQDHSDTFILPDGRALGFARFGADDSTRTVFHLYGLPDSRLGAAVFHEPAKKLGLRVIGIDRAGIGLSDAHAQRTLLDDASDLRYLAKHLELEKYSIVAVSGGGPYGLACAHALPAAQLQSLALVCAMGPYDNGTGGMRLSNRLLFSGFVYVPGVVRWLITRVQTALLSLPDEKVMLALQQRFTYHRFRWPRPNAKDAQTFRDHRAFYLWMLKSSREFFRQGYDAFMEEGRILTTHFGFEIRDVRPDLPIRLWYGKQDTNVPVRMGEQITVRLGGRASFQVEDETHISLLINCRERILEELSRNL